MDSILNFMKQDDLNCIFTIMDDNGVINTSELECMYEDLSHLNGYKFELINDELNGFSNYIKINDENSEEKIKSNCIVSMIDENNNTNISTLKELYEDLLVNNFNDFNIELINDKLLNGINKYIKMNIDKNVNS